MTRELALERSLRRLQDAQRRLERAFALRSLTPEQAHALVGMATAVTSVELVVALDKSAASSPSAAVPGRNQLAVSPG